MQIDLPDHTLTVGLAKTSSGTGRIIPLNSELERILSDHRAAFTERFGMPDPSHFLFPWGSPRPTDPGKPMTGVKHAWEGLRKDSGVRCRLHDLRHTFATRLAENGVPESTMLSLMGHMSRAMLERYSHIRMAAKRTAVAGVSLRQRPTPENLLAVPGNVPVSRRKRERANHAKQP
jgi:integrase